MGFCYYLSNIEKANGFCEKDLCTEPITLRGTEQLELPLCYNVFFEYMSPLLRKQPANVSIHIK